MKKIPSIMLVSSICVLVVGMCCYVVGGQRFAKGEEHSNVYVKFIKMEVLSEKVYCTRIIGKGIAEIYMKEPLVGFEFRRHSKDELELILHYQSDITSMLYTDCPEGEENNITIRSLSWSGTATANSSVMLANGTTTKFRTMTSTQGLRRCLERTSGMDQGSFV